MVRTYGASFEKLYAAAVGTRLGDAARTSAVAVLAAKLTGSPAAVSVVLAMSFAPWLLFGLPAGALVDRWDKRRAFLTADSVRCAAAALLCSLALSGRLSITLLIVFVFLLTTLQTVSDSCFNSLLPSIVEEKDLGAANARLSASQSTVGIVAAPLGSWLAIVSSALPFLLNVVTFGAAAGWVTALPRDTDWHSKAKPVRAAPRTLARDIRDGLGAVRTRGLLSTLLLCVSVNNFCNGLNSAMLPLLSIRSVGLHPAAFGFLTGAGAACMVAGNLLAGRLADRGTPHHHVAALAIGMKLPGFLLICAAHSPMPLALGTATLGLASGLWNVPSSTLLMTTAPREMIGRTMALFRTVSVAGMPLGALASGLLGSLAGVRSSSLAAAVLSGMVLVGYLCRLRRLPSQVLTSPAGD
ncbi:MFS transporter [Streptomyces sp. TG1A-8]|uniref:MFS transporter n=1 Tax=Streptomyces sp. TG1A-8 TaxID=3051385 RepID=UPI00265BEE72|nr:MFS transporter [Streptomyces sp. TG1A-8]MDO0924062.1 MFS transporter [Streptomyces sp. TG1A-8]